ncbi:RNA polymerase subunit sigma-70 [Dactylosporangium fulvum]|uniref:RNA polymerase subunit sigma-70 n=1 Tax=Dactylosporangium fulvum TaxID=53359 RepID=A0ABY5WDF7_9ACTN|nr:RNA polymerase subunit sigma-70 [Dactylosporangium fulvum]
MKDELDAHRVALTGYCYRMLGSAFDAEDAVQETLLRAWRNADRFDPARASLKTWLFAIATNVCLDALRGARRRALALDLEPGAFGEALPDDAFVGPVPDALVVPPEGDPAELAVQRESIRLAFVAALQALPPKQRAVLILREVLSWRAAEVAALLDTSVPAVNSALQRARAALATAPAGGPVDEELLERYVRAFTAHDVPTLVSLLHEDATMAMPPLTWWLRGRDRIAAMLAASDACRGDVLVRVRASGGAAFGQYRAGRPFAVLVLEGAPDGRVAAMTTFLTPERLFPLFGLPPEQPVPSPGREPLREVAVVPGGP